jgi:predicted component of type VI protein secretion system
MFIDGFVIRGHEKVIDHYRRLRDSSKSELERQEFQRRMDNVGEKLKLYVEERLSGKKSAA